MTYVAAAVFLLVLVLAVRKGIRKANGTTVSADVTGWIYFAAGRDTPVLMSTSLVKPTASMIPTQPVPFSIIYMEEVPSRVAAIEKLWSAIGQYQIRPGWFDRDAALYYIDHLKGEV